MQRLPKTNAHGIPRPFSKTIPPSMLFGDFQRDILAKWVLRYIPAQGESVLILTEKQTTDFVGSGIPKAFFVLLPFPAARAAT